MLNRLALENASLNNLWEIIFDTRQRLKANEKTHHDLSLYIDRILDVAKKKTINEDPVVINGVVDSNGQIFRKRKELNQQHRCHFKCKNLPVNNFHCLLTCNLISKDSVVINGETDHFCGQHVSTIKKMIEDGKDIKPFLMTMTSADWYFIPLINPFSLNQPPTSTLSTSEITPLISNNTIDSILDMSVIPSVTNMPCLFALESLNNNNNNNNNNNIQPPIADNSFHDVKQVSKPSCSSSSKKKIGGIKKKNVETKKKMSKKVKKTILQPSTPPSVYAKSSFQ